MKAKAYSDKATAQKPIDPQAAVNGEPNIGNRPKSPLIPDTAPDTGPIPVSEIGEKSVAGRKKMKGGEKWDMATGKEAAMVVDKQGAGKEPDKVETQEEHDVDVELNRILKKGPSKSETGEKTRRLTIACISASHHLLQIMVSLLEKSQINPIGNLQHRTRSLRRRIGPAPSRHWSAIGLGKEHWPPDGA